MTTLMKQQSESKVAFSYTRFSTIDQKKGDSARRQLEAAKEWCQKNGYILSEQRFLDEGKSGYKGKNITGEGDLKRFIDLIESGKIRKGSVLILESFDRLSRLKPSQSVALFLRIINNGVGMVFTMTGDKQLFTEDEISDKMHLSFILSFVVVKT